MEEKGKEKREGKGKGKQKEGKGEEKHYCVKVNYQAKHLSQRSLH